MKTTTKFKQVCFSAAVVVATSTSASAQDWSGAYAGISLSQHSGENTDYIDGVEAPSPGFTYPLKRNGNMVGFYGGYRIQSGALVFGPEISFKSGDLTYEVAPKNKIPTLSSVALKAGYAMGDVLVSLGAGYFSGSISPTTVETFGKADFVGTEYSIGIDYLVTENMTLGLVASNRSFDGATYALSTIDFETRGNETSFELRLGYNF